MGASTITEAEKPQQQSYGCEDDRKYHLAGRDAGVELLGEGNELDALGSEGSNARSRWRAGLHRGILPIVLAVLTRA